MTRPRHLWLLLAASLVAVALLGWLFWPRATDVGVLRWGGDATGGEPYLMMRPGQEPGGFEGEIMQWLAAQIGKPARFVQKDWEGLPADLGRGDIDAVFNGVEWTPEREAVMLSTVPYFAYRIRLISKRGGDITGWADLRRTANGRKPKIGVLRDSAAHRYLVEQFGDTVDIVALGTEGVTVVLNQVRDGDLQATVQDGPATKWYLDLSPDKEQYQQLVAVGDAIKPTRHPYYCVFVRDPGLRDSLNVAIQTGLADGSFRTILEKYGLWDTDQTDLLAVGRSWPPPESPRHPSLASFAWQLVLAARFTVALAVLSFPLAVTLGLLIAVGRLFGPWLVRVPLSLYVEVVRGTPLVLQLVFIYYFLPYAGLKLSAFTAAVLALGLNYAAYEAEIYRAGLLAIPRGQMEAALSLGMTPTTALWRIVVPQAVRMVVPPVTNDFIALFKDTAVCSIVAVHELTQQYRTFAVNNPGRMAELAILTAILYLMMSYPLSLLARWLEMQQERAKAA